MKENFLVKLAISASLLGILALFFISGTITVEEKSIDSITLENLEEYVKVKGVVTDTIDTESVLLLKMVQPREITVVVFKNSELNISEGTTIEIIGKVDEYENNPEIIAELIRVI